MRSELFHYNLLSLLLFGINAISEILSDFVILRDVFGRFISLSSSTLL
jgi:hypothetical protein